MNLGTTSTCDYCKGEIDTGEDGWGGRGENIVFHLECLQMNEGVAI